MKKTFIVLFLLAALLPATSKPIQFTLGNWLYKPATLTGYVMADGTVPLTADWNVGAFDLTAVDMTATGNITGNNLTASPTLAAESITFDETFDSPAPSGWSFGSTKWTHSTGTTALICDTMNPVAGTVYKCVMTVEWTSGTSLSFAISGTTALYITSAGTYTCYIKATATTPPRFTPSTDFVGAVTSLSNKETNGRRVVQTI